MPLDPGRKSALKPAPRRKCICTLHSPFFVRSVIHEHFRSHVFSTSSHVLPYLIILPYLNTLPYLITLPYLNNPHYSGPIQWAHGNCALKRSVAACPLVVSNLFFSVENTCDENMFHMEISHVTHAFPNLWYSPYLS